MGVFSGSGCCNYFAEQRKQLGLWCTWGTGGWILSVNTALLPQVKSFLICLDQKRGACCNSCGFNFPFPKAPRSRPRKKMQLESVPRAVSPPSPFTKNTEVLWAGMQNILIFPSLSGVIWIIGFTAVYQSFSAGKTGMETNVFWVGFVWFVFSLLWQLRMRVHNREILWRTTFP